VRQSLIVVLIACIAACTPSGPAAPIYTVIATPAATPGAPIAKPGGSIMLTVRGRIAALNSPDALLLNRDDLARAGVVEYDVTDPFLLQSVVFRGVLMSDLLRMVGADPDAETVSMIALNDYIVDIPIAELTRTPVLFAFEQDGVTMTPDYRGPAMLVFPYDDFTFEHQIYEPYWIWQITAIEIR
jgi:hypothetical protein